MTASPAHRIATFALGIALAAGAGCAQRAPATGDTTDVETASPLVGLSEDTRSAVRQATQLHRTAMSKLPGMAKTVVDACRPGTVDGMRLTVSNTRHLRPTFVVDIAADPRGGGDATWRVFQWDREARRELALPPRAVRLDGNGWVQARQLVADPRFALLPPVDESGLSGTAWVIESCLRGRYTFVRRWEAQATDQTEFVRVARGLVELAGAVCTLPGGQDKPLREGHPPC